MKTEIFLIRHGEVSNPKNIEYLRLPGFRLSENGVQQIKNLQKKLKNEKITKIYSSPMERAIETAKIISDKKIPIEISENLNEANYLRWQGLKRNKLPKDEREKYETEPDKFTSVLGESLAQIEKRVIKEIKKVAKKNIGKKIALTFHGDPIAVAILHYQKRPLSDLSRIEVKLASATSIIFNDKLECEEVQFDKY